jgi:hypothetical protein
MTALHLVGIFSHDAIGRHLQHPPEIGLQFAVDSGVNLDGGIAGAVGAVLLTVRIGQRTGAVLTEDDTLEGHLEVELLRGFVAERPRAGQRLVDDVAILQFVAGRQG